MEVQVCGRDWGEHSSATGGYYSCNRFVPAAASAAAAEPSGLRSFLSSLYGRVQVRPFDLISCLQMRDSQPNQAACLWQQAGVLRRRVLLCRHVHS